MIKNVNTPLITCLGICTLLGLSQCKKALVETELSTSHVEFPYLFGDVTYHQIQQHSFFELENDRLSDTVWFPVRILGLVPVIDSRITVRAFVEDVLPDNTVAAEPGKHYRSFEDPEQIKNMYIPAGDTTAKLPIVLFRTPDLKNHAVQLTFEIISGEELKTGSKGSLKAKVTTGDFVQKPEAWQWLETTLLGSYGPVKHLFLIERSGKPFNQNYTLALYYDTGLQAYYKMKVDEWLKDENATRHRQGLPPLREDPNDESTTVTFP